MIRSWLTAVVFLLPAAAIGNLPEPADPVVPQDPAVPGNAPILPEFETLQDAVDFWVRVYSETGTSGGFIHDNRYLDVVYAVVQVPRGARAERARLRAEIDRYRALLQALARGEPPASPDARHIAELWSRHDARALAGAADRIRFQRGQADRFRQGLGRAGIWQDFIRDTLREAGVPEALAALPHVESSFDPTAHSHAGASGLWQFTASTGRRFMQIDHVVDERLDPFLSTRAAAQLLRHNYEVTGSWPLAITAYNHGAAGTRRAVEQLGTRDLGVIAWNYRGRSFGFASRNFYAAFLAALEVERRAEELFGPIQRLAADDSRTVVPEDYLSARTLAAAVGVDLEVLRRHNPALRAPVWNGDKHWPRGFPVRLPPQAGNADPVQALLSIPAHQRYTAQVPDKYHQVRPGEALSVIAARYGTSVNELAGINGLRDPHHIRAGLVLTLPAGIDSVPEARPAVLETRQAAAVAVPAALPAQAAKTPPDLIELAVAVAGDPVPATPASGEEIGMPPDLGADPSDFDVAEDGSIEIQPFETLGHYAQWLDLPAGHLRRHNDLRRQQALIVGQRLSMDFSRIDRATFESRRRDFHRALQETFFTRYHITGTASERVRAGDSLWRLSRRLPDVPIWLLRQYNPDLDFTTLKPGTAVVVPVLEAVLAPESAVEGETCAC